MSEKKRETFSQAYFRTALDFQSWAMDIIGWLRDHHSARIVIGWVVRFTLIGMCIATGYLIHYFWN